MKSFVIYIYIYCNVYINFYFIFGDNCKFIWDFVKIFFVFKWGNFGDKYKGNFIKFFLVKLVWNYVFNIDYYCIIIILLYFNILLFNLFVLIYMISIINIRS